MGPFFADYPKPETIAPSPMDAVIDEQFTILFQHYFQNRTTACYCDDCRRFTAVIALLLRPFVS